MGETTTVFDLCELLGVKSSSEALGRARELVLLTDSWRSLTGSDSAEGAVAQIKKWKKRARKAKRLKKKLKALKAASVGGAPTAKQAKMPKLDRDEKAVVDQVKSQMGVTSAAYANAMRAKRDVDPASSDVLEDFVANKLTKDAEPNGAKS